MDDSFPPSEIDYAKHIAANNNIDIEESNLSPPLVNNTLCYNFSLPPSHTRVFIKEAPITGFTDKVDIFLEPFPPSVILHSANIPADPSLWDRDFVATSLFGTNKFLQSNVYNIVCSLQYMAFLIKQRSLQDHNSNNISQLESFSEATWTFISAIFESGWDQLHISDNNSIWNNIALYFRNNIPIRKTPPSLLLCLCKGML